MKTYRIYAVVIASLLVWNCKPDELTTDAPTPRGAGRQLASEAAPSKNWDVTYGGETTTIDLHPGYTHTGNDDLETALAMADGGILLGGSSDSRSSGNKPTNSVGGYDYWLINLDKNGTKRGLQTVGSTGDDKLSSALLTKEGDYLLGGSSNSPKNYDPLIGFGDKTQDSRGFDFWVVKLKANGGKVWDMTIGGSADEYLSTMVPTPDGGYLLGGTTTSSADTGVTKNGISNGTKGQSDYWIVKIDANGNKLWDQSYGTSNSEDLKVIVPTTDGNFLLAGVAGSYSTIYQAGRVVGTELSSDYWIVKIDGSGHKLWDKTLGSSSFDELTDAVATTDGGFLLGGISDGPADGAKSQPSKGSTDGWLVKVDGSGNKVWDKTIGTSGHDEIGSLVATADGGYLLGAVSEGTKNGDKTENGRGSSDYWIIKTNDKGAILWDKTIGGSDMDIFTKLIVTADDGILAAGSSYSPISGEKTQGCFGMTTDYWAVKLSKR